MIEEFFNKKDDDFINLQKGRICNPIYELWISNEALEDIKKWSVDIVDENTRKELYGDSRNGS